MDAPEIAASSYKLWRSGPRIYISRGGLLDDECENTLVGVTVPMLHVTTI
jgi:hypothetical protein